MRPILLRLQAFGPYKTAETIAFADLGPNKLFLIHGETGAGKTSLLDAMVFALYGDTSGGERLAAQMRCESAEPSLATEVAFSFGLGRRSFHVLRRPKQGLAGQRGAGVVQKQAEARLWETTEAAPGGEGKLLATKIREVDETIRELLGFSSEQFRQVVILPQGKFRDLLAAGSDKREEILRQLFRTEECADLERRLRERAQEVRQQRDDHKRERQLLLRHAGVEDEALLEAAIAGAVVAVGEAGERATAAEAQAQQAVARLAEAEAADEAFRSLRAAATEVQRLTAGQAATDTLAARLARAREAELVQPLVQAASEMAAHLTEAERERADAEVRHAAVVARRQRAAGALETELSRGPAREAATVQVQRLAELRGRVAAWTEAERRRDGAEAVRLQAATALGERQSAAEQCRAELDEARAQVAAALQASAGLSAAERALVQSRAIAQECAARDAAAEALAANLHSAAQAEAALADEQAALGVLEAQLATAEAAWRSSRAALLARDLVEGVPCPVCGATTHPSPAHGAEAVDDAELDERRERVARSLSCRDAAREALAAARLEEGKARAAYEARLNVAPSELSAERADLDVQACAAAWSELRAAAQAVPDPQATLARHDAALRKAEAVVAAAQTTERSAADEAARSSGAAAEAGAGIPVELRDAAALEAAVAQARAELDGLEADLEAARAAAKAADEDLVAAGRDAEAAQKAVARASDADAQARARRDEALRCHGFAEVADYEAGRLEPEAIAAAEAQVREFREALARAQGGLAQARQTAGQHPVGAQVDEVRTAAEAATAELRAAQERAHETSARLSGLREVGRELGELERCAEKVAHEFEIVGTLDQVANGQWAGGRITFQRWVLGAYLDDVLVAASRRLALMSRNRFRLERQREIADLRRATGLDLAVFDAWSNRSRPAVTLSGGESFLAALSLALGLAETVQEQAGATPLETIFVDEGFGALDAGALDLAMDALMELKDTGRLVGVITHVPELRDVIDARLEVTGGPGGSRTRFIVP